MNKSLFTIVLALTSVMFSCSEPDIDDGMLDGDVIFDASLYNPEEFLVSAKYPNPTSADLSKHIVIAVHGYSASTFEWDEFKNWTDTNGSYRISQVLLDGHGRTYEEFKNSTWKDWKLAILEEYQKLESLGYTKISVLGASAGSTLLLEMVTSGYFDSHVNPKNIFLIDPILLGSSKVQSIAALVGPMLGFVEIGMDGNENKYWYRFRPQETIQELNAIMKVVRKDLEKGVTLPSGTYMKVYHSKQDPVASSTSTVLIYKGLTQSNGSKIDVEIMESDIHVFTRLALRSGVTTAQYDNQEHAFSEIALKLN